MEQGSHNDQTLAQTEAFAKTLVVPFYYPGEHERVLHGVAVVASPPARRDEARSFVKRDRHSVRFPHFQERPPRTAFSREFERCPENSRPNSPPPHFRRHGQIQNLRFVRSIPRKYETRDAPLARSNPALKIPSSRLRELLRSPRRRSGACLCDAHDFEGVAADSTANLYRGRRRCRGHAGSFQFHSASDRRI